MAQYAKDLLRAETSAIYLPDPGSDTWRAVSVVGVDAEEIKSDPIQTGRGIIGNIAITKEGRIVNNASQASDAVVVVGTVTTDFEHIMGVPILSLDRVTGLMAVWRTGDGDDFSQTELDFLKNLAQQASIAIENARLFQSVNESQGQLSEALRIARIGYFEIDWVTQEITLTDELFSLLNTSAEKEDGYQFPLDQTLQKFIVEDDIPLAAQAVEDAISAEAERSEVTSEVRYKTHDGRIIWVSSTTIPPTRIPIRDDSSHNGDHQDQTSRVVSSGIEDARKTSLLINCGSGPSRCRCLLLFHR
jgi:signal transduction protein with GAF and PtsI domain